MEARIKIAFFHFSLNIPHFWSILSWVNVSTDHFKVNQKLFPEKRVKSIFPEHFGGWSRNYKKFLFIVVNYVNVQPQMIKSVQMRAKNVCHEIHCVFPPNLTLKLMTKTP